MWARLRSTRMPSPARRLNSRSPRLPRRSLFQTRQPSNKRRYMYRNGQSENPRSAMSQNTVRTWPDFKTGADGSG